jgi:hypothetical protein
MDSDKKVSTTRNTAIAVLAFFVLLTCWSFGSSIGSGGDIDAHISSIWCAWGEKPGICEDDTGSIATVPYMFQMCDGRPIDSFPGCDVVKSSTEMQELRIMGPSHRSVYYKFMRLFASINPTQSILIMRMVNSLIASFLLFGLLKFTHGRTRFAAVSALTFTLVPVAIVRIPSINPHSWATLGVMTSWAFLHGFLVAPKTDVRRKFLLGFFIFAILLPATTRVDATTYVVFTSAIVLLHHLLVSRRISRNEIMGAAGFAIAGIASFLISANVRSYISLQAPAGYAFGQYLLFQIVHIPESLVEVFGYSIGQQGSGPGIVGIIGLSLFILGLSHAMQNSNKQQLAIAFIILAFLNVVMFKGSVIVGSLVPLPGTYVLGLITFLLGMSIITSQSDLQFMSRRGNRRATIALLSITHALFLFTWMESYTKGSQIPGFFSRQTLGTFYKLSLSGGWWWNSWIGANFVYLLGVSCLPIFFVFAWRVVDSDLASTN